MGSILPDATDTNHPTGATAMNEWADVADLTDDDLKELKKLDDLNRK